MLHKKNGWWVALLLPCSLAAQPTNNPIFKGGQADGWVNASYAPAITSITKGGQSDGWTGLIYTTTSQGNIFKGGQADGWTALLATTAYTNITKGGTADGWSTNYFQQAYVGITKGGISDGWASTYQPNLVLPVTLLSFTAEKLQGKYSKLVWITTTEINNDRFEIERGTDGINFSKIAAVKASPAAQNGATYTLTDSMPQPGVNYYRIKQYDKDGQFSYSPARTVKFDEAISNTLRLYPNPASNWVNIELGVVSENTVINIIALNGHVVGHIKVPAGSSQLIRYNAGSLPKSTYMIHVISATRNQLSKLVLQ